MNCMELFGIAIWNVETVSSPVLVCVVIHGTFCRPVITILT